MVWVWVSPTGSIAEGLSRGSYLLNVTADASWTIVVTQPRKESAAPLPHTFSGTGQLVVGPVKGGDSLKLKATNQSTQ
jgi:hypothetical protein